jgi:predicted glycosyltransferase involved in capsule biosynthesis
MAKHHFLALGGYDEEMLPMTYHDWDLLRRAGASGLDLLRLEQKGTAAIRNDAAEKLRYTGVDLALETMKKINCKRSEQNIRDGRVVANRERKPRTVHVNFTTEVDL